MSKESEKGGALSTAKRIEDFLNNEEGIVFRLQAVLGSLAFSLPASYAVFFVLCNVVEFEGTGIPIGGAAFIIALTSVLAVVWPKWWIGTVRYTGAVIAGVMGLSALLGG